MAELILKFFSLLFLSSCILIILNFLDNRIKSIRWVVFFMLTHEKPMIDLICLLVNYFFISVKFFKETHTCLTNYLMLLLFPF